MSETKHTPGPWRFEYDTYANSSHPRIRVFGENSREIAEVFYRTNHDTFGEPEPNANARLIVAAPDLLEACREVLRVVDEAYAATGFIKVAKTSEQRMRIEDAIAKAEGGPR